MYAATLTPSLSSSASSASSASSSSQFRKNLSAVYARRCNALREMARARVRTSTNAWDAVQDAFLHVLENPPSDTSERSLSVALDVAVRTACHRQVRQRADDEDLSVALRKRSSV